MLSNILIQNVGQHIIITNKLSNNFFFFFNSLDRLVSDSSATRNLYYYLTYINFNHV